MKAAIYVRVSTVEQAMEGYSIPAQISLLKTYASTYQYDVVKIYQDAGISGKNIEDRPAVIELLEDAKAQKYEVLLIWKLSRLSRSLLDLLSIVDELNKSDISLVSYSEKFDTATPIGKMLLQLLGSIAEFERNTIVENVKMGLGERFKQGYSKGAIPFGYMPEDKKAIINPEQANMVKFAFKYYIDSNTPNCLQDISKYFEEKGFKTRAGGTWDRNAIKEMLMNSFYAGYVRTGVKSHCRKGKNYKEIKGQHDPIVDIELFEKVNEKLSGNKNHKYIKNPENEGVLTGLIICPKCGSRMYALNTYSYYINKAGEKTLYDVRGYRCIQSSKGKQFCEGFSMVSKHLESKVLSMIFNILDDDFIISAKKETDSERAKLSKPIASKLKFIEKKLSEVRATKDKYYKIIETAKDFDPKIFAGKFNEIERIINDLEAQKEAEKANMPEPIPVIGLKTLNDRIKAFKEAYDIFSNADKKTAIRAILSQISISSNKELLSITLVNGVVIPYHR